MPGFVFAALALVALVLAITYHEARRRIRPISPPIQPQPPDSPYKRVDIQTDDGLNIAAWHAPPGASGASALLLHGHSGNRDQLLPLADYLLEAGYGALAIDFRHHGDSDGDRSTLGIDEIRDARAAYRYLAEQADVQRIVIWGHSMGGAVAAQLMSETDAAGLFVDATFADFAALARQRVRIMGLPDAPFADLFLWMLDRMSGAPLSDYRPSDFLERVSKPVLFFHGDADAAIPLAHAKQIAAANPLVRLSVFNGGGHSELFQREPDRYRRETLAYMAEALQPRDGAGE